MVTFSDLFYPELSSILDTESYKRDNFGRKLLENKDTHWKT